MASLALSSCIVKRKRSAPGAAATAHSAAETDGGPQKTRNFHPCALSSSKGDTKHHYLFYYSFILGQQPENPSRETKRLNGFDDLPRGNVVFYEPHAVHGRAGAAQTLLSRVVLLRPAPGRPYGHLRGLLYR